MSPTPDAPTPTRAEQILWMLMSLQNRMYGRDISVVRKNERGENFTAFTYHDVCETIRELAEVEASAVQQRAKILEAKNLLEWTLQHATRHSSIAAARLLLIEVLDEMPLPACPHKEPTR